MIVACEMSPLGEGRGEEEVGFVGVYKGERRVGVGWEGEDGGIISAKEGGGSKWEGTALGEEGGVKEEDAGGAREGVGFREGDTGAAIDVEAE